MLLNRVAGDTEKDRLPLYLLVMMGADIKSPKTLPISVNSLRAGKYRYKICK